MAATDKKQNVNLKVVILGKADIGKTTLINRYISGQFDKPAATIGVSFFLKQWGSSNIAIWDTAGEEKFRGLSKIYCRGAGAAILAFDLTNPDAFHSLRAEFVPLLDSALDGCIVVVVGTKLDLVESEGRGVTDEDGVVLAQELNASNKLSRVPYFETSSLTGVNVAKVFEYVFEQALPKTKVRDSIVIGETKIQPTPKSSSCSC